MNICKKFSRWWTEGYGGQWEHYCDFSIENGESLTEAVNTLLMQSLTIGGDVVPIGRRRNVSLYFAYDEEDCEYSDDFIKGMICGAPEVPEEELDEPTKNAHAEGEPIELVTTEVFK